MLRRTLPFAAVLLAACATGTGPGPIQEEYALVRVNDAPLPARVGSETWIADTIRFHAGGEWSRVSVVRLHADGASEDPVRRTSDGFVTLRGDEIVLDFECNDVILRSCVAPDTVRTSGDGLVRYPNYYGEPTAGGPLTTFRYQPSG